MNKYKIGVYVRVSQYYDFEIKAESEEEARDLAYLQIDQQPPDFENIEDSHLDIREIE